MYMSEFVCRLFVCRLCGGHRQGGAGGWRLELLTVISDNYSDISSYLHQDLAK